MSLKLGNTDVDGIMLGDKEVSVVYKGTEEVWTAEEPVVIEPIPDDKIAEVFMPWPYTADYSDPLKITNGFNYNDKGGLLWIKCRNVATDHRIYDTVRGFDEESDSIYGHGLSLISNKTDAESMVGLREFNDDGFTVDQGALNGADGWNYMSWSFQKRPGFMDIVEYEGTGYAQEIPHRLGCKPGMILVKRVSSNMEWCVYHSARGPNFGMALNEDRAEIADKRYWDDTEPTDTHFTVGNGSMVSSYQEKYIAYLFAGHAYEGQDDQIIKCGSYTGNNSSTQAVDCGFKAGYVLVRSVNSGYWAIVDAVRGMPQTSTPTLRANESLKEVTGSEVGIAQDDSGFFVNGGKYNDNGTKYVYMAIKADPNFRMPPEWQKMNQEVAEKVARQEAVKEAAIEKVKNSKDKKDDS